MKINQLCLCFALIVCTSVATWARVSDDDAFWPPNWHFRQPITVHAEVVADELINFPVLVRLTAMNFDFEAADSQGNDVRFFLPDGTPLAHDRERHDSVDKDALYWVRLPVVSAMQDTVFYLYYGNEKAADGANSHDVWTADYIGVWHLNDTNGETHFDASSNALHGIVGGEKRVAPLDGEGVPSMIGGGVRLNADNTDQYILTPSTTIDTTHGLTLSVWAKVGELAKPADGVPVVNIGGGNWHPYYRAYLACVYAQRFNAVCSVSSVEGG